MCNLYNVSPKGEAERYIGKQARLPDYSMTTVGPFQPGLFVRPIAGELVGFVGQWALIRPGAPARAELIAPKVAPGAKARKPQPKSTNNARLESVHRLPTFSPSWKAGQRCLIPAAWYQEPNWETGKNIWWHLRRADGQPWMLAGLWSEWTDPETGELVPNFTMITRNCNEHPMLNRLHKPDPFLKPGQPEDKRSLVHVEPERWDAWLHGNEAQAREVLAHLPPPEVFDQADARRTDLALTALREPRGQGGLW
ncbi:SOS response-associated peptidase [Paucibacter sp. O1-1]|nr:SOS response-associated peptidase [Paucibacter sp. O1-1]MDA3829966.1 SOS response-associated peptidase [Paucibacter sp. O1-1]